MEIGLNYLRENIEKMNKFNQLEVLRILKNRNIHLNENKNGVLVNLTEVNDEIIQELETYVNYVNAQERNLSENEKQKEEIKNTFFVKKS
jgi:hypothetical protein